MSIERDSPQLKGERLNYLRTLARLTRLELSHKAGVGKSSISYWEDGKGSGLTKKAATKLITVFRECGIDCSREWLLDGHGSGPQKPALINSDDLQSFNIEMAESDIVKNEIKLFKSLNKNPEILIIKSDNLMPFYHRGDVVAAPNIENSKGYIGKGFYIIETGTSAIDIAYIANVNEELTPFTIEEDSTGFKLIKSDIPFHKLAKIIWHRTSSEKVTQDCLQSV